jgi:hypothetical protein
LEKKEATLEEGFGWPKLSMSLASTGCSGWLEVVQMME